MHTSFVNCFLLSLSHKHVYYYWILIPAIFQDFNFCHSQCACETVPPIDQAPENIVNRIVFQYLTLQRMHLAFYTCTRRIEIERK
jgi:hypothetical protein